MSGKNIVLCSDGTGNTAIKARGTNVFKLYEAVDIQGHKYDPTKTPQVAFYGDGVGTSRLAPHKLLGEAFGLGFAKNVRELYTELVHVYEPGDHLFLFGFSRGAYTVRALSGLIQYCGILDVKKVNHDVLKRRVNECWTAFRREAFQRVTEQERRDNQPSPDMVKQDRLRRERCGAVIHDEYAPDGAVTIDFVGVWDTVGAVGMPFEELRTLFNWFWPMRFSELTPSSRIMRACHALSVDDDRRTFSPELWNEEGIPAGQVDQVWFAGVHSNVGGGYVKHGMSLVALDWMMAEAERSGLRFIERDREYVRTHQDVHDELYDARAGLGVYYRWEPRDIGRFCEEHHMGPPKVHVSVFERLANSTGGYAPINIPDRFQVVGTGGTRPWPNRELLDNMTRQLEPQQGSNKSRGANTSLLDGMSGIIRSGKQSYFTFVAVSLLLVGAIGVFWCWPQVFDQIVPWCPYPISVASGLYACLVGLVWGWSKYVDNQMESIARSQWLRYRNVLRNLLSNDLTPRNRERLSQEVVSEKVVVEEQPRSPHVRVEKVVSSGAC